MIIFWGLIRKPNSSTQHIKYFQKFINFVFLFFFFWGGVILVISASSAPILAVHPSLFHLNVASFLNLCFHFHLS